MRGFTLLELLVVIALMALVVALVPPLFSRGTGETQFRATVQELASGLQRTRVQAIASNRPVLFQLDLAERHYQIGEATAPQELPEAFELRLITADSEIASDARGGIRFYPDGGSTGGEITVADGDRHRKIIVDWLTGRVAVK